MARKTPVMTLDDLVEQLAALFGNALRAVVLYGSAARRDAAPGADRNVLVLVDTLDPSHFERLGETTRAWGEAGNPPPLTFTVAEWRRSADVFPMEYADILDAHRVLAGTLPLDGLVVERTDLRLEAEREAMGKVLRFRQGMMHAGADTARQAELLRASAGTVLVLLRAALRVAGHDASGTAREVIARAAPVVGLDAAAFLRVRDFVEARDELSNRETASLMRAVLAGLERLVDWLDSAEPVGHVGDAAATAP
jgi:predicted nucleotidyltransferase